MKDQLSRAVGSLLFLVSVCSATAANACIDIAPFEIQDIRQADAIFTGKLVRYERVSPGRPDSLDDYALLTIRVHNVIKGKVSRMVQLYWWNSTFGVPETREINTPLLIAAVSAKRRILPLRGGSATVFPTRRPDLLQLMQAPCSSPFLLDDTQQNIENVRKILRGETVRPHNYFAVQAAQSEQRNKAEIEHRARVKALVVSVGSLVVAAAVIALFMGLRRKRRSSSR